MTVIQRTVWAKDHIHQGLQFVSFYGKELEYKDIYEFGVFHGETLLRIKDWCSAFKIHYRKIYGFDSFEGLPDEKEGVSRFNLFSKGAFSRQGNAPHMPGFTLIKKWFSELTPADVLHYDMKPASFVHIDSDLYISAKQALTFLFSNKLIQPGTVITYDEFRSTERLIDGGESKAHIEIANEYNVEFEEFFRNEYQDGLMCWQNCFVVKSFDKACMGVENAQC